MSVSIGIDIGGTFTDFALEQAGGRLHTLKLPTTPGEPARAVLDGVGLLLRKLEIAPGDVTRIVHGTTLATNALIERRGARTAFLTTAGFRDVLATGNESRAAQYELFYRRPAALVARRWRLPVGGRIGAQGQELAKLDEDAVIAHAAAMRAAAIESVAVGYLHAYAQPAHEQRTRALLARHLPGIPVSLSSEVSPEIREYERFCTTVANAYVQPVVAAYLARLRDGLREMGIAAPLLLMLSSGGLATVETAMRFPVRLLESGPAGGAIFASRVAREMALDAALAFDMGGTTAKLCLLDGAEPRSERVFEVDRTYRFAKGSGMPIRLPVIELVEIGAGGGSIARIDPTGRLRVGPESAGAEPGPACFGRGGAAATVTDANLTLGRLEPAGFGGGRMRLDAEASTAALGRLDPASAAPGLALAISEIVEATMAAAARVHAAERGAGLQDRTLVAFGGGAPLHALRLAESLEISRVIVPRDAGVGSALGFLWAAPSYEAARGVPCAVRDLDTERALEIFAALENEARAVVAPALDVGVRPRVRHKAQLRYRGQGQDITVALADDARDAAAIEDAFVAAYTAQYGAPIPGVAVELIALGVVVSGPLPSNAAAPAPHSAYEAPVVARREVWSADGGATWPVLEREALRGGAAAVAPLLVTESATTTVVPPGWRLAVTARGHLLLERTDAVAMQDEAA